MAEDRFSSPPPPRETWQFTNLFRTARVAMDPRKLLFAAAGLLTMSIGWYGISWIAYSIYSQPKKADYTATDAAEEAEQHRKFNEDTDFWLQFHRLAGSANYATTDYYPENGVAKTNQKVWGGKLRTLPWYEDRGPNPYLLVTGKVDRPWETTKTDGTAPAEKPAAAGQFVDWFISSEVPVLLEPFVKFLTPIIELINPNSGTFTRFYLLAIILWTMATWAFFGGAISRMAAVELAGKDTVTMLEAVKFVWMRYVSYLLGPLVPLILVFVLVIVAAAFGLLHMIPVIGDIFVSGLFWPVIILIGLGMALLLVGLVGYPLMYPTISTEGSDTLDALTRSYNYVFTSPWNYIGYWLLTILYGAVVVFFVGFMGSLTVYLGKWGISNTPMIKTANRSPEFLFIYTPTSFGWRQVLLDGSKGAELASVEEELTRLRQKEDGQSFEKKTAPDTDLGKRKKRAEEGYKQWTDSLWVYNKVGAGMVSFWITLLFLMVLGFGYSFFWTSSAMIYLLMRKKVDEMDLDEVYLEEADEDDYFGGAPTTPLQTIAPPASTAASTQIQESLSVRQDRSAPPTPDSITPSSPSSPSSPPPPPPPPPGDGSS
jgi:hypothetical protein